MQGGGRSGWCCCLCRILRVCDKRAAPFAFIALLERAVIDGSETSVPFMNSAFETFETKKENQLEMSIRSLKSGSV